MCICVSMLKAGARHAMSVPIRTHVKGTVVGSFRRSGLRRCGGINALHFRQIDDAANIRLFPRVVVTQLKRIVTEGKRGGGVS